MMDCGGVELHGLVGHVTSGGGEIKKSSACGSSFLSAKCAGWTLVSAPAPLMVTRFPCLYMRFAGDVTLFGILESLVGVRSVGGA